MESWIALGTCSFAAFLLTFINIIAHRQVRTLPLPETPAGQALAVIYLGLLLLCLLFAARFAARLPQTTAFLVTVGSILALPFFVLTVASAGLRDPSHATPPIVTALVFYQLLPPPVRFLANNLLAPLGMALLGAGIGRVIRHPNTLLAAAGFAAFFDIVTVTMGTVAIALQHAPNVIAAASVGGGSVGHAVGRATPLITSVTIGPADVLFLALFLSGIALLHLSEKRTLIWMFALLFGALAIVQLVPNQPIPALAPMGIAVLLGNWRHAAFTRAERYALIYGGAFAVVLAILMVVGARRVLAPELPPAPAPATPR